MSMKLKTLQRDSLIQDLNKLEERVAEKIQDEFHFRSLKIGVSEIGEAASTPFIFNHLK